MGKNTAAVLSGDENWQARSDLSTLVDAEQIRQDPKRYKAAQECARKKVEAFRAISETPAPASK